jgi:hypothetical protein
MSVDSALTLLIQASRVSPPLREAVAEVNEEIQRLRAILADHCCDDELCRCQTTQIDGNVSGIDG